MGLRTDDFARRNARSARGESSAQVLGGDQPAAGAVRQTHLHGTAAEMFGVPRFRILPSGWRNSASMMRMSDRGSDFLERRARQAKGRPFVHGLCADLLVE